MIRIVLADDHPVVREGLAAMLATQPDFAVVGEASDGVALLDLVAALRPDLALIDLAMPRLDGAGAIRRLRDVAPATHTLVLTALDSDERIIAALTAGARGYVLKGAPRADIFAAVRLVGTGGSLLQPVVAARVVEHLARPPAPQLTPREQEVLQLLARGHANKAIAAALQISERTVKFHLSGIMARLGARSRTEALSRAMQLGLVETPRHR